MAMTDDQRPPGFRLLLSMAVWATSIGITVQGWLRADRNWHVDLLNALAVVLLTYAACISYRGYGPKNNPPTMPY
jgi:hypothetical protein